MANEDKELTENEKIAILSTAKDLTLHYCIFDNLKIDVSTELKEKMEPMFIMVNGTLNHFVKILKNTYKKI